MANPKFAWGIDIGNRALKAIKLVREGDALRMDDVEVIEHEQVLSNSGDNRDSLIQTALANFAQRHSTKGGVVSVGVSGQSSFARFIKLPPVEENKIPEIVRFEAIQQIPFPLEQVEWSYQLFRQPDSPDVEVGIFAMRKELVNQQIKFFTDMDMDVQVVQMSPLAVYNAMYYDNRLADGTTMILDLGAENADLIIAEGESVWLRSVPIGGNNFTEALVKAFKLNFAKAEDLKRNAQTSKYARQIFQAMRPIFADLVAEIQRSIGFYSSVHRDSRIKRIVALGNTFRLPTLQKYLQQNLQIEVDRLDAFNAGSPEDGRLAAVLNDNIASMAGAYGLALQAMGQGKIESSLLPYEIRQARVWKDKTKWFAAAASICLLAAGVKFGTYYFHNDKYESTQANFAPKNDSILRQAQDFDSKWTKIESSGGPDKIRVSNVNSLQLYRDLWGDLWVDITKSLPPQNAAPVEQLKSTPRGQREQIFVESLNSTYYPDLGSRLKLDDDHFKSLAVPSGGTAPQGNYNPDNAYAPGALNDAGRPIQGFGRDSNFGRGGRGGRGERSMPVVPTPEPDASAGTAAVSTERGYIVTMQLVSPNESAPSLVDKALVKGLVDRVTKASALKEGKKYYIARVMLTSAQRISNDDARKTAIRAAYDARRQAQENPALPSPTSPGIGPSNMDRLRGGGGAFNRGRFTEQRTPITRYQPQLPGNNAGDKPEKDDAKVFADPLFPNEQVLNDWLLTVVVAVVIDPKADDAAAPGTVTAAADTTPAEAITDRRRTVR